MATEDKPEDLLSNTSDVLKQGENALYSYVADRLMKASGDDAQAVKEFLTTEGIGKVQTAGKIWVPGEKIGTAGASLEQLKGLYQKFKLEKTQSTDITDFSINSPVPDTPAPNPPKVWKVGEVRLYIELESLAKVRSAEKQLFQTYLSSIADKTIGGLTWKAKEDTMYDKLANNFQEFKSKSQAVTIEAFTPSEKQMEVLLRGFATWPPASFERLGNSADAKQRKQDITDLLVDELSGNTQAFGDDVNAKGLQAKVYQYYERLAEVYVDKSQHIRANEPMVIGEKSVEELQLHWENIVSESKRKLAGEEISVAKESTRAADITAVKLEDALNDVLKESDEEIESRQKKELLQEEDSKRKKETQEAMEKKEEQGEDLVREVLYEQEQHHREEEKEHQRHEDDVAEEVQAEVQEDKKTTHADEQDDDIDLPAFFEMAERSERDKTLDEPQSNQEEEKRKLKQAEQTAGQEELKRKQEELAKQQQALDSKQNVSVRIGDQENQSQTTNNQNAGNDYPGWFNRRYVEREKKGEFYKNTNPPPDKPSIIDGPENGQLQVAETSDETIKDVILLAKARGSEEIIIEGGGLTDDIAFKFLKEATLQRIKAKINPPPVLTPEREVELAKAREDNVAMDARPVLEYRINDVDKAEVKAVLQEANDDLGYLKATEQSSDKWDASIDNIEEQVRDKCGPRELVSAHSTQTSVIQSSLIDDQPLPPSVTQLPTPPPSTQLKPQVASQPSLIPMAEIPPLEMPLAALQTEPLSPPLTPKLGPEDSLPSLSVLEPTEKTLQPLMHRDLPPLDLELPTVIMKDGLYTVDGGVVPKELENALKARNDNLTKMKKTDANYYKKELASIPEKLILTKTITEDFKHLGLTGVKEIKTMKEGDDISGEVAYKNPANGDAYVILDRNPKGAIQSQARVALVTKAQQDIMKVDLQRGDVTREAGLRVGVTRGQEQNITPEKLNQTNGIKI